MRKAISIETMFTGQPLSERFRLVREAGFDYIELGDWTGLDITLVKELKREYRLGVSAIDGIRDHLLAAPEGREDFFEYLSQSIAVARMFDCTNLIIRSDGGIGRTAVPDERSDFNRVAATTLALLDAADKAVKAGMTLLLKPVGSYCLPAGSVHNMPSAADVVKMVDSPGLKLLYNVPCDQKGSANAVCVYGALIGYIHIEDSPAPAGIGRTAFSRALDDLGYAGFVGFQCRPDSGLDKCFEDIRNF